MQNVNKVKCFLLATLAFQIEAIYLHSMSKSCPVYHPMCVNAVRLYLLILIITHCYTDRSYKL